MEGCASKFEGKPLGENPGGTFRVDGGNLGVDQHLAYAQLGFGHLFHVKWKFSHYLIRVGYRISAEGRNVEVLDM